jgi:hypothetical protein
MNEVPTFDVWLERSGLAAKTQRDYYRALEGRISVWARDAGIIGDSIFDVSGSEEFASIRSRIETLGIFRDRNAKENYRFSAALARFTEYLEWAGSQSVSKDLEAIRTRADLVETQKQALVNARLGQGTFRHNLLRRWESCALLGVRDRFLLVASHIKPWAVSTDRERLDLHNGLLLTAHVDRAFDCGRISFDQDGGILISPRFRDAAVLGINERMKILVDPEHLPYLRYHRDNVFADS